MDLDDDFESNFKKNIEKEVNFSEIYDKDMDFIEEILDETINYFDDNLMLDNFFNPMKFYSENNYDYPNFKEKSEDENENRFYEISDLIKKLYKQMGIDDYDIEDFEDMGLFNESYNGLNNNINYYNSFF